MTKELDFLESMKDCLTPNGNIFEYTKKYKDIRKALQRLEAIDNANPSEAMKCLNKIDGFMKYHELYDTYKDELTTIKQALLKAQEQDFNYKNIVIPFFDELVELLATNDIDDMLDKIKENKKVLEIIKQKKVDIWKFIDNGIFNYSYDDYYFCWNYYSCEKLTEEEFDLLKRYTK